MLKLITGILGTTMLVVAGSVAHQDTESELPSQDDISTFMKVKLNHTKEIVEGLAMEDFQKISRNAQDLAALSHDSQWNVMQTEAYLKFSQEFRQSAFRLRDSGHDKNLDGATLAFFEVTLNCVRCHKYVRQGQ